MSFDAFLSKGWGDHGTDAEGVFARLPEGERLVTEARHLAGLAGLAAHVAGDHLGRFDDGVAFLERLETHATFDPTTLEGKAVIRSKAALHLAAGRRAEADRLEERCRSVPTLPPASNRIRILATASAALVGQRRTREAAALLEEALGLAAYGPDRNDPAARALAVTGNNLACELETRPSRTPEEAALMVRAAETGLRFWSLTGTWLETERAHYRLSCSQRLAGNAKASLEHAEACRSVVERNAGDAGEQFYAQEALALAHRAAGNDVAARRARDAAAALLPKIADEGFRSMAQDSLRALDTSAPA
ncbi:MAG: hypothetical protein IT460_14245 [Planctomycetes bacterium]|nr:hypothetical protein [Planctomycetota bacterium]